MKVLARGEHTIIGEAGVRIGDAVATGIEPVTPLGTSEKLGVTSPTAHGIECVIFGSTSDSGELLGRVITKGEQVGAPHGGVT